MAAAVLLVVAGVWILLQTVAGDLPRRIASWGSPNATSGGTSGAGDTDRIGQDSSGTGAGGGFSTGGGGGGGGGTGGGWG
jgi:hypothetical protein